MNDNIDYRSTFVNALSDVLSDLMPTLTGSMGGATGGMMGMLVNAIAPEIPNFLEALDDNTDMQIMFGTIITKLNDAVEIDKVARQMYADQFSVVSNEVEQAEAEAESDDKVVEEEDEDSD